MVEGTPPRDALPPPPQRAKPVRKGARCGAGAGSPRPHRPHPGHTGRGTLAACTRGQAAGGGTAPDTRRPSQRWQVSPPGDGPPPPPRQAAPTGHAGQGDSVGPPHPHTNAHSTWVADPNSPPSARAGGGGTAPDLRRPSEWWKAPPPGTPFRHPHSEQSRPARAHAVGPVLGPQARTDRTRDTWVAEPWLPAPDDGRPGEGQRLTPDAPHNGGRHPPRGRPPNTPTASNASPQGRTLWGWCWVPTPAPTAPGTHGWRSPGRRLQRTGGRGRDGACHQTPLATVAGHPPPGTAPHHARGTQRPQGMQAKGTVLGPQTHTPALTARGWRTPIARPVAGQSVEGQRLTSDAPHNGERHPPPGTPYRHPHSKQRRPARAHAVGPVLGPQIRTTASGTHMGLGTLAARSRGRAAGGGTAPDTRRPPQWWKAPPPGTPIRHPHSEQRQPARAHAVGPVLGPHARTDRTRDTRVVEPRPPAPEDGRPGEGRRLSPDAPGNGGRPPPPGDGPPPPPRHAAPTGHAGQGDSVGPPDPHSRAHSTCPADPNSPPSGRAVGGGTAPDLRRSSQWWKAPPPGTPIRQPHSEQRRPARAHAVGPVLGPHVRTDRTRNTRVAEPWLPAREDGRPGEGQRLTPDAPHNGGRPPPPGTAPPPSPRHAALTGHASQGDSVGPPDPHSRAHSTWPADPNSPPSARAGGGGTAPDPRRPSQWWKAPPRGRPSASPTASNAGPQGCTLWGRCWVPTPAPTAPGTHRLQNPGRPPQRAGGRERDIALHQTPLTTVAGQPPRGRPPSNPAARSPHRACRPRGQCWAPTPTRPRPQHVGGGPQQPAQWAGSSGRGSA